MNTFVGIAMLINLVFTPLDMFSVAFECFLIHFTIADSGGNLIFSLTNVVLTKQIPFT